MPEIDKERMGGTMRLGRRVTILAQDSITKKLYNNEERIYERHRHRYEVNPKMVDTLEKAGLMFVGRDETGERMEVAELQGHPYFVGTQFHPEYQSRPLRPSPPFYGLIRAAKST